jgi:hypothetical protein
MSQFANIVVRLIEDLRRMTVQDDRRDTVPPSSVPEESRPPKRPWEDISRDDHSEVCSRLLIHLGPTY